MGVGSLDAALTGVLVLATAVWLGGYITITIVAAVATRTLQPAARVAFFRSFGKTFGVIGTTALAIALGTGATLAADHPIDGRMIAAIIVAALLVTVSIVGMLQAHHMTLLRRRALASDEPEGTPAGAPPELTSRLRRGARSARMLRVLIGVLSLVLLALGALLLL